MSRYRAETEASWVLGKMGIDLTTILRDEYRRGMLHAAEIIDTPCETMRCESRGERVFHEPKCRHEDAEDIRAQAMRPIKEDE